MLATAATLVLPQLNGNGIGELLSRNYVFKAGFCAWLVAQTAKVDVGIIKSSSMHDQILHSYESAFRRASHVLFCSSLCTQCITTCLASVQS